MTPVVIARITAPNGQVIDCLGSDQSEQAKGWFDDTVEVVEGDGTYEKDFDEAKHPRDEHGRFADAGTNAVASDARYGVSPSGVATFDNSHSYVDDAVAAQEKRLTEATRVIRNDTRGTPAFVDGPHIDLRGAVPETAKGITDAMVKLNGQFPAEMQTIKSITVGFQPGDGPAYAVTTIEANPAMRFNPYYLSDPALLHDTLAAAQEPHVPGEPGWLVKGETSVEALTAHEFGHVYMDAHAAEVMLFLHEASAQLSAVSLYADNGGAASATAEGFAEAFADHYINGGTANETPGGRLVGQFIAAHRTKALDWDDTVEKDFDETKHPSAKFTDAGGGSQYGPRQPGTAALEDAPQLKALADLVEKNIPTAHVDFTGIDTTLAKQAATALIDLNSKYPAEMKKVGYIGTGNWDDIARDDPVAANAFAETHDRQGLISINYNPDNLASSKDFIQMMAGANERGWTPDGTPPSLEFQTVHEFGHAWFYAHADADPATSYFDTTRISGAVGRTLGKEGLRWAMDNKTALQGVSGYAEQGAYGSGALTTLPEAVADSFASNYFAPGMTAGGRAIDTYIKEHPLK
jgi:hypothetical protein